MATTDRIAFKKGSLARLPAEKTPGTFYVTTDECALYLDVDSSTRIRVGDFQEFETLTALQANGNPSTTALYYIRDVNCLAKWNGSAYVQINLDTGATSVEVTGDGNAVTDVSYDPTTRRITLTMGKTFVEASEIGALAEKDKVAKADLDTSLASELDGKVASVTAGDSSVAVGGTAAAPTITAKLSGKSDNALKLRTEPGEEGLYVPIPAAASEYDLVKDTAESADFAAVYHLTKDGENIGVAINIPKDMVVQSGSVVNQNAEGSSGTFIKLVLANATEDELYIDVANLIEYVTSGSAAGDMVVITVSDDHKVTATITDGSITEEKLHADVQAKLDQAHMHTNAVELAKIADGDKAKWDEASAKAGSAVQSVATGTANGTISVDGTDVAVHGLDSAAYAKTTDFDAAGAADAVKGTSGDAASADTVCGAKAYANAAVEAAMTWGSF